MKRTLYISVIILSVIALFSFLAFRQEAKAALMKIIYPVLIDRGLVGYWTMNGSDIDWATGVVSDASGNGNTGQLISMSTTTSPVIGIVGQGLKFTLSDNINLGATNNLAFATTSSFTMSAWIKSDSISSFSDSNCSFNTCQMIFYRGDGSFSTVNYAFGIHSATALA